MTQLNEQYIARPAVAADIPALFEIFNQYFETLTGMVKYTLEEFQNIFTRPGFDMGSSMQVITLPSGEVVACGAVIDLGSPPVHPSFYGAVRPEYEGQGLGSALLEWGETRARQAIQRCPEEARVSMYAQGSQSHPPTVKLLESAGLTPVRYSWFMMKDLDEVPPQPIWPDGIRIEFFNLDSDLETILNAVDAAFADHWGYIDHSADQDRLERFRHSIESDAEFDPSLWFLAMDEAEIAGMALCASHVGPDKETGFVETLGVRPQWRKQGLGLALLQHTFGEFLRRGYQRVGLGVDTQNLSGATRLYHKAGMQVIREITVYEKELRPGVELARQA